MFQKGETTTAAAVTVVQTDAMFFGGKFTRNLCGMYVLGFCDGGSTARFRLLHSTADGENWKLLHAATSQPAPPRAHTSIVVQYKTNIHITAERSDQN